MTVRGIRRRPSAPPEGVEAVYTQDRLMEQLGWADVVLLSLPETQDTRALMGREQFQAMKRGGYVLNVGRGSAIDQGALLWAVQEGIVAGAGLDVTTPEPLPPESPLWQEPNILITPHVSGGLHAQRTHDNIFEIAAHNIAALPDGSVPVPGGLRHRVPRIKRLFILMENSNASKGERIWIAARSSRGKRSSATLTEQPTQLQDKRPDTTMH